MVELFTIGLSGLAASFVLYILARRAMAPKRAKGAWRDVLDFLQPMKDVKMTEVSDRDSLHSSTHISAVFEGRPLRGVYHSSMRSLELEIDVPGVLDFRRETVFTNVMSGKDTRLGDTRFDDSMRIGDVSSALALAVFDHETRAKVTALSELGLSFDFGVAKFAFGRTPPLAELKQIVSDALALAEHMKLARSQVKERLAHNAEHDPDAAMRFRCFLALDQGPSEQMLALAERIALEDNGPLGTQALQKLQGWAKPLPLERLVAALPTHEDAWKSLVIDDVALRGGIEHLAALKEGMRDAPSSLRVAAEKVAETLKTKAKASGHDNGQVSMAQDEVAGAVTMHRDTRQGVKR